jgi:hypothetical protein
MDFQLDLSIRGDTGILKGRKREVGVLLSCTFFCSSCQSSPIASPTARALLASLLSLHQLFLDPCPSPSSCGDCHSFYHCLPLGALLLPFTRDDAAPQGTHVNGAVLAVAIRRRWCYCMQQVEAREATINVL